jgi:hypothetical protein
MFGPTIIQSGLFIFAIKCVINCLYHPGLLFIPFIPFVVLQSLILLLFTSFPAFDFELYIPGL